LRKEVILEMVKRFHKQYDGFDWSKVPDFCREVPARYFSSHSIQRLRERGESHLQGKILSIQLNPEDCFEYYLDDYGVKKAVFRCHFDTKRDIVLVVAREGLICSMWWNNRNDHHKTLDRRLYNGR